MPQKVPAPWAKNYDAKAPEWGQIFGANPPAAGGGGVVMAKIDSAIILYFLKLLEGVGLFSLFLLM